MKKLGQHVQPSQLTYHLSQKHVLFVVARFFFFAFFFWLRFIIVIIAVGIGGWVGGKRTRPNISQHRQQRELFFRSTSGKSLYSIYMWRGTLGVPNTVIPWEKLVNTEIACRQSTKYRYCIYDRSRLLKVVSILLVCLSQACMHQQLNSARKRDKTSNWSVQRSKSPDIGCFTNYFIID